MSLHEEEALGKAYDARLMRRLLTYLWPYRRAVSIALAAIVGHSVLQLAQPYLTMLAIDSYIATGDLAGLNQIAMVFLVVLVGAFVLEYVRTYTLQMTGQRIMFDLRMQVYGHLQKIDVRFYDRNPVGRLMTRVTTDVDVLNEMFASGVVAIFGDVFMLIGIMAVLLSMDWRLALVAFSVLPLIAIVTQWFRRNVRETYRTVRVWIARINAYLQEHLTGMATVQLFRREARSFDEFDEINRTHRDANVASIFYYAVFYPLIELVGALAASLIIWFGGGWVLDGSLTLGVLVAFLLYAQRFFRPISDMSEKFNILQAAMASSERIFKLLDTPVEIESPAQPVARPDQSAGRLEFDGAWFAYNDDDYVLRDLSFVVEPGERVGIVGATGAGKTTIINLLMRFYDVSRGRILVDGVDVREMDLDQLRRLSSLVLQDVHLFAGSIASNVRLGDEAISDADVRTAIANVHADRFVDRLPDGIASPVAERGATLSVGQKQLLSFA
ncbi:MAG: ABC transporter ATP-binding protein, partial [Vicinamibacterales bacterium]|nr:ABC transporter ATP-binding protein [Vicinamibacterales bacterium]